MKYQKQLHDNFCNNTTLTIFLIVTCFFPCLAFTRETPKAGAPAQTQIMEGFFNSPWLYVAGIVVFILLLAVLLRGSGKRSDGN